MKVRCNLNQEKIFNNGSIELVNHMGNDLTVVNAARVSFNGFSEELEDKDRKLIEYLARNRHDSPFRHVQFQFLCTLPEVVTRQLYKHVVGIAYTEERTVDWAWNEVSGRYIEAHQLGFWVPEELRIQSKNNKQGSEKDLNGEIDPSLLNLIWEHQEKSQELYERLLAGKVCKEQARSVLTTAFNTKFTVTLSLQALFNLIKLRDHKHAQEEIREVVRIMKKLAYPICPVSFDALLKYHVTKT